MLGVVSGGPEVLVDGRRGGRWAWRRSDEGRGEHLVMCLGMCSSSAMLFSY